LTYWYQAFSVTSLFGGVEITKDGRQKMHKSRLAGLIIDCKTDDLDSAAEFWSKAIGAPATAAANLDASPYVELKTPDGEPYVEIQKVSHESRVHIDIEADDIEAEVKRLEALGAKKLSKIKSWWVLEAPTGQRFCVVPVVSSAFESSANTWTE
jgi:predicted enzyme related to lactoylglutathione lyase